MLAPGPWTEDCGIVKDANGVMIVDDLHRPMGENDAQENFVRRLILAAPELLEAVKALVPYVPNTDARSGPLHYARMAYDQARALIRRIEEQP